MALQPAAEPVLSSEPTDAEFDAYWEEEARNPHRNRIRIGRQYQATIPSRLKSESHPSAAGEADGRKLEQLETLAWRRDNGLNDDKLDDYFFTSRAISLLARFRAKQNESACDSQSADTPTDGSEVAACIAKNGTVTATPADSRPGPKSRKEYEERKALLTAELVNLATFVTSHHPVESDSGCHCKDPDVKNEKWSVNEARLFAHALENYGKNFGAIKKAMPWKPAKSLIDHYYKKTGEENNTDGDVPDEGAGSDGPDLSPAADASAIFPKADFATSLQVACFTSSERFDDQSISWKKKLKGNGLHKNGNHINNISSSEVADVIGAEVKPVKAKPIFPSESTDSAANGNSLLGSLKFFMDGQLVLKLNANQQDNDKKCHWVESQDTPKIVRSVRNKKYKNNVSRSAAGNGSEAGGGGETSSSKASEDTADEESGSDDESLDSESRSLPSPSDWRSTARKCKSVKVENNCLVPVATSAQLLSLSPTPGERTPKNHKQTAPEQQQQQTAASPSAACTSLTSGFSSAKRSSDFSAFSFDDAQQQHSPADSKKIKKRLKSATSASAIGNSNSNKHNHKTLSNNHTSPAGKQSVAVFSRPDGRTSGRGPPAAHSSLIDLSSSGSSTTAAPRNLTADDGSCGLDLSVKPMTRSSSGSPSSQLQYSRTSKQAAAAEKRRHASGSAAVNLSSSSSLAKGRTTDFPSGRGAHLP